MPRDSYPAPQAPPPRPKKKKRKKGSAATAESPARFQQVATNVFQASGKIGRSAAASAGSRLNAWFWAFVALWTPLRLVLLGCVAICAATAIFVLSSDRSEQAVMDLKAANEAARKALDEHEIPVATEQLGAAVAALDRLDRHDDPLSREIRQLHRETTAIRDSLPVSPLQVVAEADAAQDAGKVEQFVDTFRRQYRNRWMIVDGAVSRNISGPARGQHAVRLPLRFGREGRGVELNVQLADLDVLIKGGKPRRAVFAVQLVSCELSADKRMWSLGTDSQSAFLWGMTGNYEEAGFVFETPDERQALEQVLTSQRRLVGLPEASARAEGSRSPAELPRQEGGE